MDGAVSGNDPLPLPGASAFGPGSQVLAKGGLVFPGWRGQASRVAARCELTPERNKNGQITCLIQANSFPHDLGPVPSVAG